MITFRKQLVNKKKVCLSEMNYPFFKDSIRRKITRKSPS